MKVERIAREPELLPGPVDSTLLGTILALVLLGLYTVYSASFAIGWLEYQDGAYFLKRQLLWAALGLTLMVALMAIPYYRWRRLSVLVLFASLLLLAAVLVPGLGLAQSGASRWLKLGPLPAFQPSEFAKLGLILYVAAWLSSRREALKHWSTGTFPFVLLLSLVGGLILLEPDLGTAIVFALVTSSLLFLAGVPLRHFFLLALAGAGALVLLIFGAQYRADRWQAFVDPYADPQGIGFQIIQALLALGSGGLFGVGLGASRQKFGYIPGAHTDGVFAIIGEEIGFIGAVGVLLLFAFFVYQGFRLAQEAPDRFSALLVCGIVLWFSYQALINIGGVTHSIPLTGIPLPFLSYGGSALAANLAAMGVLLNVSRYRRPRSAATPLPEAGQ
jgi:cell division protein FtsW